MFFNILSTNSRALNGLKDHKNRVFTSDSEAVV